MFFIVKFYTVRTIRPSSKHLFFQRFWSVYRNGSLENKKRVITGSQAIFFSKKAQKSLQKHMDESKPIQIDGYFSKFSRQMKDNKKLTFHQMKPKIGYEEDHQSLISKDKDWKKYKKPN